MWHVRCFASSNYFSYTGLRSLIAGNRAADEFHNPAQCWRLRRASETYRMACGHRVPTSQRTLSFYRNPIELWDYKFCPGEELAAGTVLIFDPYSSYSCYERQMTSL